jgi:hypothetical protein
MSAVNFAVNNDGYYYPQITASFTSEGSSVSKLCDGNYWYLKHPPNRWTSEGSPNRTDWIEVDLGTEREVHTVKLYVLDDRELAESKLRAPQSIEMQYWNGTSWESLKTIEIVPAPNGHRPHVFKMLPQKLRKLRATLVHSEGYRSGLSEIEVWGDSHLPIEPVSPPTGNLAWNSGTADFPRATASHHDRFGGVPENAIDGKTNFLPMPMNRWTSYESQADSDWLEIDFGKETEFRRVELAIYDDRGGVQSPANFEIEHWDGTRWQPLVTQKSPAKPIGSQWNSARFPPVVSRKLRIVFTNAGKARSGVSEVMVWND